MLINVRTEKTYDKVIYSKITRDGYYVDTLAFKIPLETDIRIEDVIQVISPKVKEKYRVREIVNKQDYKDVFCKHVFFDSEKIVIDNFSNQGRDNNLESLVRFLNDKLNSKRFSGNSFKFNTNTNVGGVVNFTETVTLFDMIFKEKGIIDTYNCEVQYHDWNVTFVDSLPSNNTEILFHEKKNITELSNLIESKDLTTKLYVTCTYKENKDNKNRKDASYYQNKFNQREQKIVESQKLADNERTQRRQEYLDNYNKPKGKRTREQIHADYLARLEQQDAQREQRRAKARQKRLENFESFQRAREDKQLSKATEEKHEIVINYIHTSPLISQYPRVLESIVHIQSDEINTLDSLIAYCEDNFFTENDRRDVPRTTYTFKPVIDNYNINLKDIALVVYEKLKIRKIVYCIKYEYDPQNDKFYTTEFGDWQKATLKGNSVDEKISQSKETITSQIMDSVERMYYEDYLKKAEYERELFDSEFNSQFENIENNITEAIENNLKEVEDLKIEINQKIENNKTEISTEVAAAKKEALEHSKAYTDNINATIRNEVNTIQNNIVSFDSRLNDNIDKIKDFSLVIDAYSKDIETLNNNLTTANTKIDNAKNELSSQINNLNEWKITATGNIAKIGNIENTVNTSIARLNTVENTARESTQKIQELLQYKNNDNQRKEELKSYFESKTAEKLVTERNNIIRLVDNRGYVTTTSVNNIVNEKAGEITREISKIEKSSFLGKNLCTETDLEKVGNDLYFALSENKKVNQQYTIVATLENVPNGQKIGIYRTLEYKDINYSKNGLNVWVVSFTNTNNYLNLYPCGANTKVRNVCVYKGDVSELFSTNGKLENIENKFTIFKNEYTENDKGIKQKLTSLEEYKNSNNEREQSLKTYIENKTAEQLTTQRTNILSIFDAKGYVNTETVNNIVNEKANEFSRQISSVNNRINDIKIVNFNLLKGTKDFTGGWEYTGTFTSDERYNDCTVVKFLKSNSTRVTHFKNYRVKENQDYTFSCYIKSSLACNVYFYIDFIKEERPSSYKNGIVRENIIRVNTEFTKFTITFNPNSAGIVCPRFVITDTNVDVSLCCYKLEKGTIATDWTPAPEDTETYVNSKIEQKANEISLRINSLENATNRTSTEISNNLREIAFKVLNLTENKVSYNDININKDNIQIGSSKIIDGNKLASLITVSPSAIDLISRSVRIRGDVIVDGSITASKIATNSITAAHLQSDIIDARHIKANAITSNLIAAGAVRAINIAGGTITANEIAGETITGAEIRSGTIDTKHLKANSVEADQLWVTEAMINKLVTNEILVKKLMSQSAFISRLNAITISATQITSGYLSADRIRGGVISGIEVRGVTITGESKIKIGEHGYMQPGERTLQINVPRYQHANYGVGMQVSGDKYGKVPKGVFIYDDPNFDRGDTINNANEVLLTVNGMIECCSLRDNNGVQKTGYPIVTIETFNEGNKGLYPIMNMYHQDKNGTFLLFSVPGTYFSVATNRQSDRRLKKNITNTHINALDLISKIQFKAFDWKEEKRGHEKLGVIAQELEIIEPNFISKINNPDNNEYTYELDHITLGMYNLKATQELNQKIIQLEQQIQQLRIRLSEVA